MTAIGERERQTQSTVVRFFRDELGYRYLGNWQYREGNRCVEEDMLREWLTWCGYDGNRIGKVLRELDQAAAITGSTTLYDANRAVYDKLRYGVKIKPAVEAQTETIWLIDWDHPQNNDFAVAEEVTVEGVNTKRPDVVLYINGIAVGVLELKRSTVSVAEGIRQNLDNQKREFIRGFFATNQLLLAGNPSEGLRYGVIDTPEKYWLRWREDSALDDPLLRGLHQLCRKERLLEIMHDFMVFDAGRKKTCRHNQYFGVRAAQAYVHRREGGVIWHTQGSGKSLTMVWLAKWIRENIVNARVLVVTDRTELDEQIETVFKGVDEQIRRTQSGADLIRVLGSAEHWLMGSLIHKFGAGEEGDIDAFIRDIKGHLPANFHVPGQLFVFVDECHRSQSGKLHEAMKAILPEATLIGFTGTPLLKKDKRKSIEVFGPYIHTYKYDQAVHDGVVLDLRYEARDIDQRLTNQDKVDQWFEIKTRGMTDYARAQLKKRWGTLQKVLSTKDRLDKIVADILWDMATRDRLQSGHGNAMLVAGSIHAACRLYEMFQQTELADRCAIVTSYTPATADIKGETTGEGETDQLFKYATYRRMLARHFDEAEDTAMHKAEQFEREVKQRFIHEPAQMKLLIVVDKLLTGFDAPPATYLYIDKKMADHNLFQAICRVNRLDGEDKEVGYIVDYKDLFQSLEQSINDYTGGAFEDFDHEDVAGLLEDRLSKARERLDETRETLKALCEGVQPPQDSAAFRHYFVGASDEPDNINAHEPRRVAFYKQVAAYLRAYAGIANEMADAGYNADETATVRAEVADFEALREEIKLASGDYVDMKLYEPAMRHLLDTYIRAEDTEKLSAFDDMTLVELIVERGEEAVQALPDSMQSDPEAMAETIENNVRRLIVDESDTNPAYYERMSRLLDELIEKRRQDAFAYREYLQKIMELTRRMKKPQEDRYPASITSPARRALYDNLKAMPDLGQKLTASPTVADHGETAEQVALQLHEVIAGATMASWRGNTMKERRVRKAITGVIADPDLVQQLVELARAQRDY